MPEVWSVPANGGESIVESYGYRTDVLPAYTNAEQRVQLRSVPLETLEFSIAALEAREAQLATALIFGLQDEVVVVPLWQYASRIVTEVPIGTSTFFVADDPRLVPYRVGGYAVAWLDAFTFELFTVSGVFSNSITTSDNADVIWPVGSLIYPARRSRLPDRVSLKRESTTVLTGRVRFTMEQDLP